MPPILNLDLLSYIDQKVDALKRAPVNDKSTALLITKLLIRVVHLAKWSNNPLDLIQGIRKLGTILTTSLPKSIIIGNIIRRILFLIRDEIDEDLKDSLVNSLFSLLSTKDADIGSLNREKSVSVSGEKSVSEYGEKSVSEYGEKSVSDRSGEKSVSDGSGAEKSISNSSGVEKSISNRSGAENSVSNRSGAEKSISNKSGADKSKSGSDPRSGSDSITKKDSDLRSGSDLRSIIIQGIKDLEDEIKNVYDGIEPMSVDVIHDNEVLLTPTPNSETVLRFLIKARTKRKFTVLVTENYPNHIHQAHLFVKKLAENNIEAVLIPDTLTYAVMSRVGKVIIGSNGVFVNGGCKSNSGVANVVECAKEHKTPVFAVAGLYKLSPLYPFDRDDLIEVGNSGKVLNYHDSKLVNNVEVVSNPLDDYIPPEHIDIYITNIGGFAPSFIYRIVLDNYKQEDTNLVDV